MNELGQRIDRAVESILENESLTADLDDAAARVLLDWGIACARMIAQGSAGLNDLQAEQFMSPRLRATRRLMRVVNRWVPQRLQVNARENATLLAKMIEQAAVIFGQDYSPPTLDRRKGFLRKSLVDPPPQVIENLRVLIENLNGQCATHSGGTDDQENQ